MPAADTANTGHRGTHGTAMKSITGWNNNGNGTNASGFNAFPVGGHYSGSFYYLGDNAYFWSATELSGTVAWNRTLFYSNAGGYRYNALKMDGLSCRCIKD